MSIKIKINYDHSKVQISTKPAGTLLSDILIDHDIHFEQPCGGIGICGKCLVRFVSGAPEPNEIEDKHLSDEQINEGWRLSCQCILDQDAEVILPKDGSAQIMEHGLLRIQHIDYDDSSMLNDQSYGIAIDLGTTTIVCYLVDLHTGTILAAASGLNPQRKYGDNVITRCDYIAKEEDGLDTLRLLALSTMNEAIQSLIKQHGVRKSDIKRAALVGNTIMQHIICGVDPTPIAVAPFTPAFTSMQAIKAKDFGLDIDNEATVYIGPALSGYVGGDAMAAVKAVEMDQSEELSLLIDIGTNGEIVLGNKDRMMACSAAAGPAFEGTHIRFGTGGIEGAINKVTLQNNEMVITTIADKEPIGICGSGLVDAAAVLKHLGILQSTGQLDEQMSQSYDGETAYQLTDGIYITQKDIREIQLAKSAIAAGVNVLVERLGVTYADIKHLYLAGGFGSYLDVRSATDIGLIDPELLDNAVSAGNAAGMGAVKMLLSDQEMVSCESMKSNIEYIELSMDARFNALFIEHMML